ncbi:MAG: HAD hydrolase-like protein [Candidatus Aenigmarchaeota archaeon]|nr:HAD hydrolase-like protein [Candidatus Aenigmarchaeota archaeon]
MKRGIIFVDHDNCLISEQPNLELYSRIAQEYGVSLPPMSLAPYVGNGSEIRKRFATDYGVPLSEQEVNAIRHERYREMLRNHEIVPRNEVIELVHRIKRDAGKDFYLILLSTSGSDVFGYTIPHIGLQDAFDEQLSSTDMGFGSRKADSFAYVMKKLGLPCENSVAIDDSSHGIKEAKRARLAVIAVPNELTASQDLSVADLILPQEAIPRFDVNILYRFANLG